MESLQSTKSRLRAVGSISQITKAMEVVAATKMRRSQEAALTSRPYALSALEILGTISKALPMETPFTRIRPVRKTLVVVVASDRGLAGPFNAQIFRKAEQLLAADMAESRKTADSEHGYAVLAVGKKALAWAQKRKFEIAGSLLGYGDFVHPDEIAPLADRAVAGFLGGEWDRVIAVSTHFRTTLSQDTLVRQILPTDAAKIRETAEEIVPEHGRFAELRRALPERRTDARAEYMFEPTPREALDRLMPHLIRMQFYHLILEANASEHSARRVAMKSASDNADELSDSLRVEFNKARQAGITKEIIEITSTQSALN